MTTPWSSPSPFHPLRSPTLSLFIIPQVSRSGLCESTRKLIKRRQKQVFEKLLPRWKLGWTRLSVWLRPASRTNCDFFPGALSLSLSSLSALEPLEVSGNQSLKQTIQRARDLGKNKTKLRDVTSWAEQWPFYARAQEPPFKGIQRLPSSGLLEAVPVSLSGLIAHTFSHLQNQDVMLVAWIDHDGDIYITEINRLQSRLSPLQD